MGDLVEFKPKNKYLICWESDAGRSWVVVDTHAAKEALHKHLLAHGVSEYMIVIAPLDR